MLNICELNIDKNNGDCHFGNNRATLLACKDSIKKITLKGQLSVGPI